MQNLQFDRLHRKGNYTGKWARCSSSSTTAAIASTFLYDTLMPDENYQIRANTHSRTWNSFHLFLSPEKYFRQIFSSWLRLFVHISLVATRSQSQISSERKWAFKYWAMRMLRLNAVPRQQIGFGSIRIAKRIFQMMCVGPVWCMGKDEHTAR